MSVVKAVIAKDPWFSWLWESLMYYLRNFFLNFLTLFIKQTTFLNGTLSIRGGEVEEVQENYKVQTTTDIKFKFTKQEGRFFWKKGDRYGKKIRKICKSARFSPISSENTWMRRTSLGSSCANSYFISVQYCVCEQQ